MKSVLLVFPIPDDEQMAAISPPLSILYLGSFLENAGIPVSYIDLRIHSMDDYYAELAKEPLLVGVSSMSGYQLIGAIEVLKAARKINPDLPTVLGGVHASLLPEQSLSSSLVDFIIVGEGEYTLLHLVEELTRKHPDFIKILGLGWKNNQLTKVMNPERPFMDLAEATPPITNSSKHLFKHYPFGKIQVARGCPYRCAFCYNTSFNRRVYRMKPLEIIEREVQVIKKFLPNLKHFSLLADTIALKKERIVDIAKLTAKYGFKFFTSIRAEYIDEKLVSEIEGQCDSVLIGVESCVPRINKLILKDNNSEDIKRAAHIIAASKLKTFYSFMSGFPGETKKETFANMDFADELRKIDPKAAISPFFLCTPFPGTELYKLAIKKGYNEPKDLEGWSSFRFAEINMPWVKKEKEYFTDLYGISMMIYLSSDTYKSNEFESSLFSYLQEIAWDKWRKRKLEFKEEWKLFTLYNREIKQANLENLNLKENLTSD